MEFRSPESALRSLGHAFNLSRTLLPRMRDQDFSNGARAQHHRENCQELLSDTQLLLKGLESCQLEELPLTTRSRMRRELPPVISALQELAATDSIFRIQAEETAMTLSGALTTFRETDSALFAPLRQQLRVGTLRGVSLSSLLEKNLNDRRFLDGYSGADVMLDELLELEEPPDRMTEGHLLKEGMIHYQPLWVGELLSIGSNLKLSPEDTFCDLGAGVGRPGMLLSLLTGCRAISVEYQTPLAEIGKRAIERNKLDCVEMINGDVRDFDFQRANVFYMFNPFHGKLFSHVGRMLAARIETARTHGEQIRVCGVANGPFLSLVPGLVLVKSDGITQYFESIQP
ncbi:MAG: hypothetical protein KDD64_03920 [Bdellovibrionales bacterium]|nr:hypothetical protein [Bdellovibrionales bacterium]